MKKEQGPPQESPRVNAPGPNMGEEFEALGKEFKNAEQRLSATLDRLSDVKIRMDYFDPDRQTYDDNHELELESKYGEASLDDTEMEALKAELPEAEQAVESATNAVESATSAIEALRPRAKDYARLLLSEWPTDEQINNYRQEVDKLQSLQHAIHNKLVRGGEPGVWDRFTKYGGVMGRMKEIEDELKSNMESFHRMEKELEKAVAKTAEYQNLLAERKRMGLWGRWFGGINAKIAEMEHPMNPTAVEQEARARMEVIQKRTDAWKAELEAELESLQAEAHALEIQKKELEETQAALQKPLIRLEERAKKFVKSVEVLQPALKNKMYSLETLKQGLVQFLESA